MQFSIRFRLLAITIALIIFAGCQTTQKMSAEERLALFKEGLQLSSKIYEQEPDTYAGSYLSDLSCNCRVFLFTEAAEETLSRYSDNPNFSAQKAKYSRQDLMEAGDNTREIIRKRSSHLRSNYHIEVDEKLNLVLLHVLSYESNVSRELVDLKPKFHPSVAVVYDEDIGIVEVY